MFLSHCHNLIIMKILFQPCSFTSAKQSTSNHWFAKATIHSSSNKQKSPRCLGINPRVFSTFSQCIKFDFAFSRNDQVRLRSNATFSLEFSNSHRTETRQYRKTHHSTRTHIKQSTYTITHKDYKDILYT